MKPFALLVTLAFAVVAAAVPAAAASSDIALRTSYGSLFGTLEMPDGAHGPVPVAIIVPGSGPVDRNGDTKLGITADSYELLADALAARGIATVRYDKRGVAASAGAMPDPPSLLDLDFYVDDCIGWARKLSADRRFSRVALVGPNEGSLIALFAARQTPVDAVVSVGGAGRLLGDVIVAQIQAEGPQAEPLVGPARQAVSAIRFGADPSDLPKALQPVFPPGSTTFLQQFFNADPVKAAAALKVPYAVVQGTADIQMTEDDAQALADAAPHATLTLVPHMTAMMKDAKDDTRAASVATYTDPSEPLDPKAVDAIAAGITATR